ncbi:MAG TPA: hypothetical protein VMY38_05955 [Gemmatimonadaceae bacterium]|nr:hypothetical protein [Gemmatimonadaceae bacterium]
MAALSHQLLLGSFGALPCAVMSETSARAGMQQETAMSSMSMPGVRMSEHDHEGCGEEETVPLCVTGAACAIAAIPSVTAGFPEARVAVVLPRTAPATLRSALTSPDRPPPRA